MATTQHNTKNIPTNQELTPAIDSAIMALLALKARLIDKGQAGADELETTYQVALSAAIETAIFASEVHRAGGAV